MVKACIAFLHNGCPIKNFELTFNEQFVYNLTIDSFIQSVKLTNNFPQEFTNVIPSVHCVRDTNKKHLLRNRATLNDYNVSSSDIISISFVLNTGFSFNDLKNTLANMLNNMLNNMSIFKKIYNHLVLFVPFSANVQSVCDKLGNINHSLIVKNIKQGLFLPFIQYAINKGLKYTIILFDSNFNQTLQTYDYLNMSQKTLLSAHDIKITKYKKPTKVKFPFDCIITNEILKNLQLCKFTIITIATIADIKLINHFDENTQIIDDLLKINMPQNVELYFKFFGDDFVYPPLRTLMRDVKNTP